MVAKLERLTRSVHDATGLMLAADKGGWGLVALDARSTRRRPRGPPWPRSWPWPSSPNWNGV